MHYHILERDYGTRCLGGYGTFGDDAQTKDELRSLARAMLSSVIGDVRRERGSAKGVLSITYCNEYSFQECFRQSEDRRREWNAQRRGEG